MIMYAIKNTTIKQGKLTKLVKEIGTQDRVELPPSLGDNELHCKSKH